MILKRWLELQKHKIIYDVECFLISAFFANGFLNYFQRFL
jgi:hypothetical protein